MKSQGTASGRVIGYARTALKMDDINRQVESLRAAGCSHVFTDAGKSGSSLDRSGLKSAIATLKAGDTLMVCSLSRLSRSNYVMLDLTQKLLSKRGALKVLDNPDVTAVSLCEICKDMLDSKAEIEPLDEEKIDDFPSGLSLEDQKELVFEFLAGTKKLKN